MTVTLPYTLTAGQPENVNQLMSNLTTLRDAINALESAGVSKEYLATALADVLGVSQTATVRRGKTIIATEEARTNVAYGLMTTPDRVSSVVLPTDGLLCVAYQAIWKNSVSGAGRAAIFLGANQLKTADGTANPSVQEANGNGSADTYTALASYRAGLLGHITSTAYAGHVTTGQVIAANRVLGNEQGGVCYIFAAAGTYDVSVMFNSSSGSVTVKERKLWVWTLGF